MAEAYKKFDSQSNNDCNGQVSDNNGQVCQPTLPPNNISAVSVKNHPNESVHNEPAVSDKPAVNEPTTTYKHLIYMGASSKFIIYYMCFT